MKRNRLQCFFILWALSCFALPAFSEDEWPQFRGPNGQGVCEARGLPLTWSEKKHVRWKCVIPGEGWSSPVISGTQVWMTTATQAGSSLRAVCVNLESGTIARDVEVFSIPEPLHKNATNSYASPSPTIEKGRLYVHFGTNGTACLSASEGAILWKRQDLKLDHVEGPGSSPALWKNELIIPCDGKDFQYVIALDKQTGATLWKTDRGYKDGKVPAIHWAYCTPLVIDVAGVPQAVVPGPHRVTAYHAETGKELWWVDFFGYSATTRPVFADGLVYITTGNGGPAVLAIRPGSGDITANGVVWKMTKNPPNMPSPVMVDGRLYAVHDTAGTAFCLDSKNGADLWRTRIGGKFAASLFAAEGRIYCFDQAGVTTVLEASAIFKVLAKNQLPSGCMASPAVAGNALVLRTKTHLYRIEN